MGKQKLISIVTPMYNESEMIEKYFEGINKVVDLIKDGDNEYECEIVIVNDGSKDDTLEKLQTRLSVQKNLRIVNLSRNFGQEPAVFAGVENAKGDAVIVLDADLQDSPELISIMVEKWKMGYDIVNAKRVDRKVDAMFTRLTARIYYRTINKLSYKVKYPENVNNFRLVSRRAIEVIKTFPSNEKIFRNSAAQVGFKSAEIEFVRQPRQAGESKVNRKTMTKLALDGICDATVKPLTFAFMPSMWMGFIGGLASLTMLIFGILSMSTNIGWVGTFVGGPLFIFVSVLSLLMVFTGIILLCLSINGFYLGKTYTEVKGRPMYIVEGIYSGEE